jgi:ABC-type glycerol-3-phosphate transport system substrate-binding protein
MRRVMTAIAMLLCGGLVALGLCGPAEAQQTFAGITITHFTQAGATDRINGYKKLAEEFKAQTGATVQFVDAPWEQMQDQMVNDFLGQGGTFDVMDVDTAWDPNVKAYLEPLDGLIAKSHFDISDYQGLNKLIGADPAAHERYGIPLTGRSMVMFYRTDLFKDAGLAPPSTWADLVADAKALTKGKQYGFVAAGVNVQLNKYFYGAYKDDSDRLLFNAAGQPQFDDKAGADALATLKTLFSYAPPGIFAMDIGEADQVFLNGDAAVLIEWPDYIQPSLNVPAKSRIVGKWAAMKPPGPGNYAPWYVAISASSRHKDAAWAWLQYITSAKQNKRLMLDYGIYSTRTSVLADPDIAAKYPGMDAVVAASAASFYPSFIAHPKGIDWFVQCGAIWSSALTGSITPEQAVKQAADLWDQMFKSTPGPKNYSYADLSAK